MRLLEHDGAASVSFTKDLAKGETPLYAILSHTWGPYGDEVKFEDVKNGTAVDKPGYDKISFCIQQAQRDGLKYFWIDTCCIDKSSGAELTEAINFMFRWYSDAEKCYVYLQDVLRRLPESADLDSRDTWKRDFRKSRWFTRGWTLQELLAPKSVDFFSKEGEKLGNKHTLERDISDVTGIPVKALRGSALFTFTVQERFSWQESRVTTKEEDRYYSLLGIMGVSMPVIYGEGEREARRRLKRKITHSTKANKAKGPQPDDFSVTFNSPNVVGVKIFVSRRSELEEMRKNLQSDGTRRIVVVYGLGGIGKTQLAIEYVTRYRNNYSAIFWLNISSDDSVKSSFVKVAKQILRDHPTASRFDSTDLKGDVNAVVDAVKAWLSSSNNNRWLLIYDNYDRPKLPSDNDTTAVDIRSYLPEARQGLVIITTHPSEVNIGTRLPIKKLGDLQDSLDILAYSSERRDLSTDPDAKRLAEKLDGLYGAPDLPSAHAQHSDLRFKARIYTVLTISIHNVQLLTLSKLLQTRLAIYLLISEYLFERIRYDRGIVEKLSV